jgi:GNAT superfamily N-acetyltransferase
VPRVELQPFSSEFASDAGRLLAARHARHRRDNPELSPRYEDPVVAEQEIAETSKIEGASGAVAVREGKVVGYLLGAPKADTTWGPNFWVDAAGQAVEEAEVLRDLYGFAAARWVDEGRTAHYALVPAHDAELVDAWARVGFGKQHMHAIQPAVAEPFAPLDQVTVRPAERSDIPVLAALEVVLPTHQGLSPVFSSGPVPTLEECAAEWEEDFDDPSYATFVAERDGVVVGSAVGCSLAKSSVHKGVARPDNAGFLGFAAVFPEHRGQGSGRALAETVIWWSAQAGYPSIVTDWRVTNLWSSRAWPALGFRDTFVRMHRVIGY